MKIKYPFIIVSMLCGLFFYQCKSPSNKKSSVSLNILTDIDGNNYKTVEIGDQTWMAENLRTSRFKNGESLILGNNNDVWRGFRNNYRPGYRLNFDSSFYYYTYNAVRDERCLCPEGWKIPNDKDWNELFEFLGGDKNASKKLKSEKGWTYEDYIDDDEADFGYRVENREGNGDNQSGFNAIPDYSVDSFGTLITNNDASTSFFWSADGNGDFGNYISLKAWNDGIEKSHYNNGYGLSVRCIKEK